MACSTALARTRNQVAYSCLAPPPGCEAIRVQRAPHAPGTPKYESNLKLPKAAAALRRPELHDTHEEAAPDAATLTPPLPPKKPLTDNWYYKTKGTRVGPITATKIHELAQHDTINPDTLLWHEQIGSWTPLHNTPFRKTTKTQFRPATTGKWVWWLVFTWPIKATTYSLLMRYAQPDAFPHRIEEAKMLLISGLLTLLVAPLLNLVFVLLDNHELRTAKQKPIPAWRGTLFAPLHLHARAKQVGGENHHLIVWAAFVLLMPRGTLRFSEDITNAFTILFDWLM